jgi:hypothetical protein
MSLGAILASVVLAFQSALKIHGGLLAAKLCALGIGFGRRLRASPEAALVAEMSDAQLRDIGLTRDNVRIARAVPPMADPAALLWHRRTNR